MVPSTTVDAPAAQNEPVDEVIAAGPIAMRAVTESQHTLNRVVSEADFFQSKLSVAEKLAEKHVRDLAKQGVEVGMISSAASALNTAVSFTVW